MNHSSIARPQGMIRLALILAVLVIGCGTYQDVLYTTRGYTVRLPKEASVYVAVPMDAPIAYPSKKQEEGVGVYPGSGRITAKVIADAFEKRASKVQLASETQSLTDALKQAKRDGFKVLVWPILTKWTERSEHRRDQIVVKLLLYDAHTRKNLDSTAIRARGVKQAGTSPKELLSEPVGDYVDSLYFAR